jgi:hypothetical protein
VVILVHADVSSLVRVRLHPGLHFRLNLHLHRDLALLDRLNRRLIQQRDELGSDRAMMTCRCRRGCAAGGVIRSMDVHAMRTR